MSISIDSQLNDTLRNALVAVFLHDVVPNDPTIKALKLDDKIKTANDIYEYLLLDVLVNQDVPTSPVACTIASLQQYINGILMNMEPGYEQTSLTAEQLKNWRNEMHSYPLWAANQELKSFPALYLDPTLRLKKTDSFRQLENDINQNQIQPDTVQTAVLAYLARFEEIANLNVLNGYIDGEDFANSIYYFIAKSRAENAFYWRSLDMRQRKPTGAPGTPPAQPPKYDTPEPDAWSDWKKANLPISDNAVEHSVRPVWFNNRLFVIWAELIYQDSSATTPPPGAEAQNTSKTNPQFRLNISYKKYDDNWSAPQTYLQGYSNDKDLHDKGPDFVKQITNTIAVYDHSTSPESLFIALYVNYKSGDDETGSDDTYTFLKTARIDKNFNVTPMFPSNGRVPNGVTKPNVIIPKNNDAETQAHVLKIGRLFAHNDFNLDRFQFWLPTLIKTISKVTPTSPSTEPDTWNYNNWQKNIDDPTADIDIKYNLTNSHIEFTSKINNDFAIATTTLVLNIESQPGQQIILTLVTPKINTITEKSTPLLSGSMIQPLQTDFLNKGANRTYHFMDDGDISMLVSDPNNHGKFSVPATAPGDSYSLEGKIADVVEIRNMIVSPTIDEINNADDLEERLDFHHNTIAIASKPLIYQHIILHPVDPNIPEPTYYSGMIPLGCSAGHSKLSAGDSFKVSIPVNQTTMRPDWPNWPETPSSLPFIHGVVVSETLAGDSHLGFALKTARVEWAEKNPAKDQISPRIWHQESPSLGNAESIDFFGTTIEHSDGTALERPPIRMNTTFARHLINLAESGLDDLLTWGTQQLKEPPTYFDTHAEAMDFNGAYGLYFRELFLYLPWLVAYRLNLEQQYSEAERWLGYAFDTNRKKDRSGRPDYWNVAPLMDAAAPPAPSWPTLWPNDPDFIARSHPVHFRKALYLLYLDILANRGDAAYRLLTPDGLAEAKLWYVRILDLLGPRPDVQQIDQWTSITLNDLNAAKSLELREFELRLMAQDQRRREHLLLHPRDASEPRAVPRLSMQNKTSTPSLQDVDNPHFHLPFNRELVKYWDLCDSRLYNLRHNLDIAGKALHLPLFAAPLDPRALLAAMGQGLSGGGLDRSLSLDIPPYRFSVMHAHAMNAVDSVIQFGATLLSLIERKEQVQHLELQQQQAWDMARIAVDLQTQALVIENKNREALLASQRVVMGRVVFYSKLLVDGVSAGEQLAGDWFIQSNISEIAGLVMQGVGDLAMLAPNIVGLAEGGWRSEGPPYAAQAAAQAFATGQRNTGMALDRTAQFDRRAQEWEQALDQAKNEYAQLDAQLAVHAEQETAARLQLHQAETALAQTRATYDLLTSSNRFTKAQTYEWLNSQFATFYYQAYDATQSLCRAAEASWRYERADYSSPSFLRPGAWNSTWRGLGAGESLKTSLLQMHSKYLLEDERELEIRKTVSLRELLGADWTKALADLIADGSIAFGLGRDTFKDDYKDLYLRRIKCVSVSLPVVIAPYRDVHATLTQTNNTIERSLTDRTLDLKDLRANQQVALSTGVDDSGLFSLNFQDERYLPFEFTGLISEWTLEIANTTPEQNVMLESVTDIIVHILYTARK